MEIDKAHVRGRVWKVVEEVFKSVKMEELKREIVALLEEAIMAKTPNHREAMEESTSVRKDERLGKFWEEELIQSMLHKAQGGDDSFLQRVYNVSGRGSFQAFLGRGWLVGEVCRGR